MNNNNNIYIQCLVIFLPKCSHAQYTLSQFTPFLYLFIYEFIYTVEPLWSRIQVTIKKVWMRENFVQFWRHWYIENSFYFSKFLYEYWKYLSSSQFRLTQKNLKWTLSAMLRGFSLNQRAHIRFYEISRERKTSSNSEGCEYIYIIVCISTSIGRNTCDATTEYERIDLFECAYKY